MPSSPGYASGVLELAISHCSNDYAQGHGTTLTIATTKHEALTECSHFDLDHAGGFGWIACKVTTTESTPVSAMLARYEPREAVENI
ncbi:MAG: hypothetical protein J0M12_16120 [Deltaproteobacteria bacterium]|nr:hypothetical protein [Deltaproteobacteria bacterium]